MNPVVSWVATGVLPRDWTKAQAVLNAASSVRIVLTTSTSRGWIGQQEGNDRVRGRLTYAF